MAKGSDGDDDDDDDDDDVDDGTMTAVLGRRPSISS